MIFSVKIIMFIHKGLFEKPKMKITKGNYVNWDLSNNNIVVMLDYYIFWSKVFDFATNPENDRFYCCLTLRNDRWCR